MQISTVYFLTAFLTILPGALAGPCKPSYTCDGDLKCCTMKLQGNVGAYCTDGNMPGTLSPLGAPILHLIPSPVFVFFFFLYLKLTMGAYDYYVDTGCGTNNVICCKKDAVKSLTPRGYTYSGCSNPGISEIC